MIHPITPWTATVQSDIDVSEPIFEMRLHAFTLRLYHAGDSLWLVVEWPESGRLAFRLAFGMSSDFGEAAIDEIEGGLLVTTSTQLAKYRIYITFPEEPAMIFRYSTTIKVLRPLLLSFWPRDIVPLTQNGNIENTSGIIHTLQEGSRSGQMFFSYTKPVVGSVVYFQNLTALSEYCEHTETDL